MLATVFDKVNEWICFFCCCTVAANDAHNSVEVNESFRGVRAVFFFALNMMS